MSYVLAALLGYFVGCFQTAYLMGVYLKKMDIRQHGSTNAGASNAAIVFGLKYGLLTAFIDILKTVVAVGIVSYFFPDNLIIQFVAGLSCIVGHMFPFYMDFKGGKGFASYAGLIVAMDVRLGLLMIIVFFLVALILDKVFLSAMFATLFYPAYNLYIGSPPSVILMLMGMFALMTYKHKENIRRFRVGEEKGIRDYIAHRKTIKLDK